MVGEEITRLEDQLERTSHQFQAVVEALERSVQAQPSPAALISFAKQAQAELERFAEEFGKQLGHRISSDIKSVSNKAWYLQARKKARDN